MILQVLSIFLVSYFFISSAHGQQSTDENCETLPFQLHLIKGKLYTKFNDDNIEIFHLTLEEYDELGRLQRTCDGEVTVNKCKD
jgi:hypothetical protein